jgi:hypothetical protein
VIRATVPLVGCLLSLSVAGGRAVQRSANVPLPASTDGAVLYDSHADHLWNRIHRLLHVRRTVTGEAYGGDEIDPLLWRDTRYLLTGRSHREAIALLDEFLARGGDKLVQNPLERAVFQHDLWAVFDWVVARDDTDGPERRALAVRLARAIRRVGLSRDQIDHLEDNYASAVQSKAFPTAYDPADLDRPFLPRDLFDDDGPWVAIRDSFVQPVAGQHAASLSRSDFTVLINVPGDVSATLLYLKTLWDFPEPYIVEPFLDGEQRIAHNPRLPEVPVGTQVALVRRMLLIEDSGRIVQSRVTESVQFRVFHEATTRGFLPDGRGSFGDQDFFEVQMRRARLFAHEAGGLRGVKPGEPAFVVFAAHGDDSFDEERPPERGPELTLCVNCHSQRGVQSLGILRRLLKPNGRLDYRHPRWLVSARPGPVAKARQYDWGLLQGLWQTSAW